MSSIYITLFALAAMLFQGKPHHQLPRTDGYYLYDNGIDTFQVMPVTEDVRVAAITARALRNMPEPIKYGCEPDDVIVITEGSPLLHYVAFFNDTSGTAFKRNCRDINARNESIRIIETRKMKIDQQDLFDPSERIHAISFLNDSTFTFIVRENFFLKEKYSATIKKDGLTITDISRRPTPALPCNYTFIPHR